MNQIIVGLRFSILRFFYSQIFHSQIFSISDFHSQTFLFINYFSITDFSNYTKLTKKKNLRIKKSEINCSLVGGGVTKDKISEIEQHQAE